MLQSIRRFLGLCEHHWVVYERITMVDVYDVSVGLKLVLRCEKCGNIKSKRV